MNFLTRKERKEEKKPNQNPTISPQFIYATPLEKKGQTLPL